MIPDCLGGVRSKQPIDIEVAFKLQMGPVVEGIADKIRHGLRPFEEFLLVGCFSCDKVFLDAIGAHGPPLVMFPAKPDLGDIAETFVPGDFTGIQMAVVIDDGKMFSIFVVQNPGRFVLQQEIIMDEMDHVDPSKSHRKKDVP